MEMAELFKRVQDLTSKYPHLSKEEIAELRVLGGRISAECANVLYDMRLEEEG
ncbi:MAG TPA: hypothetical protein VEZ13_14835 [Brevibacillus sp.]|nr:hypothetical protein [Brevibacillus sp.]